jgi:hypothetical protein
LDRGGKLLDQLLPPAESTADPESHRGPLSFPEPRPFLSPELVPVSLEPDITGSLPNPEPKTSPVPVAEERLSDTTLPDLVLPPLAKLPVGSPVRSPSAEVEQPVPLPLVARPHPIRGVPESLVDKCSRETALAPRLPERVISDPPPQRAPPRVDHVADEEPPLGQPRLPGR